jgi:hypothetical protein
MAAGSSGRWASAARVGASLLLSAAVGVFGSALIAELDGAAGIEWHRVHLAWPFWMLLSIIGCQAAFQSVLERRYTRLRARLEEIERHRDPRYIEAVARARLTADVVGELRKVVSGSESPILDKVDTRRILGLDGKDQANDDADP